MLKTLNFCNKGGICSRRVPRETFTHLLRCSTNQPNAPTDYEELSASLVATSLVKKSKTKSLPKKPTIAKQENRLVSRSLEDFLVTRALPKVLILHTGGTLGMDMVRSFCKGREGPVPGPRGGDPGHRERGIMPEISGDSIPLSSFEEEGSCQVRLRSGAGSSSYQGSLKPGSMLGNLLQVVPELTKLANLELQVLFNKDSSNVGPKEWISIAQALDSNRNNYDAFLVVHGTDTLAYTASALSLLLSGFKRPIILTGSQMPLSAPRSDARSNLLDSLQCATAAFSPPYPNLQEVAVCFGGRLMRGNRCQKSNSSSYQAFDSLGYPYLATLGISVEWNDRYLLRVEGAYRPRFKLDPRVLRVPIVPGSDPRTTYGDLASRGVAGIVLETFGVGNLPDENKLGWMPWLKDQRKKGLQIYLASQCSTGPLQPALYKAGQLASEMGVEAGPQMTPECAIVKMMFCLAHSDLAVGVPIAGEI